MLTALQFAHSGEPAPADKGAYLSDICELLRRKWPHNRMVEVVCHGHSVPAGYFKTPVVDTFNAYPHLLHVGLKERFPFAVINVTVTAIGGENAEGGAARFERDVLSRKPDLITIDYALNDRAIGLERARKAWVVMIEKALAAHVKVLLLTPTGDLSSKLNDPNDPLNQHARQIRELAADYHVGLVDDLAAFQKYIADGVQLADVMAQGNHPNRKGHDLVVGELLAWFAKE
jgi:lysophospholipase L1-like esterase